MEKRDDVMEAGISVRMVLLRADYEKRVSRARKRAFGFGDR